ncbi:glycine/D-amino acid oxidase-like deaminating enzyme [Rhodoligotrophos appendicifer]|uniref:NAD(P)/FAD-dependent oxidoreductase n=1 Tax=Rhodoligotrophos appendicifer TaxID=987056 RepID=UPI00117F5739|nr:FAD-dependent oxidoreductase [Rhodoligotrophos appendicifer]
MNTKAYDVAIIGGGLVGASLAWGLAREKLRVIVLDEGDVAHRASRGNFALVWVQTKGFGLPRYAAWTRQSAELWGGFAAELEEGTGVNVALEQPGGFHVALSEAEFERLKVVTLRLHNQADMVAYPHEILDGDEIRKRIPGTGPDIVGGSYSPLDGHLNSLRLFRALHVAMGQDGTTYRANHRVETIETGDGFRIKGADFAIDADRLVLAAGLGNARLAPMVGLNAPVRPQRGQIIVTERLPRFMEHPIQTLRQTDDGTVLIGDSQEEAGLADDVGTGILSVMADRAVRIFPRLRDVRVVRSWAALRVMSPDGFPIYEQSSTHPGAFVATCHSGVTLAAAHARLLAPAIAAGALPQTFNDFRAGRFAGA